MAAESYTSAAALDPSFLVLERQTKVFLSARI